MKHTKVFEPILGEIWKEIEGYNGLYSISNFGRVRSEEAVGLKNLHLKKAVKTIKCQFSTPTGYRFVCLHNDGKVRQFYVHRLVAAAFIENPLDKQFVNHKNGDKGDNTNSNLEWVTFKENMQHAFKTGLSSMVGINNRRAVLTEEQVRKIKILCKDHSTEEILGIMNIPRTKRYLVANIKCGRVWKNITV